MLTISDRFIKSRPFPGQGNRSGYFSRPSDEASEQEWHSDLGRFQQTRQVHRLGHTVHAGQRAEPKLSNFIGLKHCPPEVAMPVAVPIESGRTSRSE